MAFIQEYKTEQSLKALEQLSPFHARVIRSQQHLSVPASHLVPGDLIYFEYGDRIPADIRIIQANGLSLDESSLTGENKPVYKSIEPCRVLVDENNILSTNILEDFIKQFDATRPTSHYDTSHLPSIPLAGRKNIGFMGSLVSSGNGMGIVIVIGSNTELGQICSLMNQVECLFNIFLRLLKKIIY